MEKEIIYFYQKIIHHLKNYQFKTFLIAIISGKEKDNTFEKPFKIKLGKLLSKKWKKEVDFKDPDILIKINFAKKKIDYQIKSLYLYGRYLKLKPGIPQTKWHIKRFKTSVEEEIGNPLLKITKGTDHSLHGCGREDIDVITIGQGRPFVIEIKNPQKRRINIKKTQKEINKNSKIVKVRKLSYTTKNKIIELKLAHPDKVYRVKIKLEKKIKKKELRNICKKFNGIIINQQTPTRVLKRRYDKLRKRKIYYCKIIKFHPLTPTLEIKSQSGTYIKELINGDNGRTSPSFSEILNQKTEVKQLIVTKVLLNDD